MMLTFFTGLLSHLVALDLVKYVCGFCLVGGCFRLVWRLVLPRVGRRADSGNNVI